MKQTQRDSQKSEADQKNEKGDPMKIKEQKARKEMTRNPPETAGPGKGKQIKSKINN